MKIKIIAVGRIKASPSSDLCDEYLKRLGSNTKIIEVDTPKAATPDIEAPLIEKHLKDDDFLVALDERGESFGSVEFSKKMESWNARIGGRGIVFLIGGADGLTDGLRARANYLMSFGKQTWPHMLVRVMLLEQIYRARQIAAGHPYHRA